jgi:hypothetical protein
MSTVAIVLIVIGALVLLLFLGGYAAMRRRVREDAPSYARHLAEADHALEQARASDRGWDREVMEQAARNALVGSHPDTEFDRLDLVLVDDRPGVAEDRAHFEASSGDRRVRVVLTRDESGWSGQAES